MYEAAYASPPEAEKSLILHEALALAYLRSSGRVGAGKAETPAYCITLAILDFDFVFSEIFLPPHLLLIHSYELTLLIV